MSIDHVNIDHSQIGLSCHHYTKVVHIEMKTPLPTNMSINAGAKSVRYAFSIYYVHVHLHSEIQVVTYQ